MNVRTIHHFEDEAQLLRWIPSVVLERFWSRHPEWVIDEGRYREHIDEQLTTFDLSVNGTAWQIHYRFYRDEKEFRRKFPAEAKMGDIVLVDLMIRTLVLPQGLNVYDIAATTLGPDAVYFLTAFPHHVRATKNIPESHILEKPPDVDAIADLLVDRLAIQ